MTTIRPPARRLTILTGLLLLHAAMPQAALAQAAASKSAPAATGDGAGDAAPDAAAAEGTIVLDTVTLDGSGGAIGYQPVSTSTATRTDTPLLDIPQAVAVVGEEVLRDQDARSLADALGNVSGITVTNTVGGTQDAIIRRGFGSSRDGSTLTNGLRTALPQSFNDTIERVEVLKGPASTLYGVLDPGGLINLVTKRPEATFGGEAYTRFTAQGAGRYGSTGGLDVTGPFEGTDLSYRFVAEGEKADYWRNFGETEDWLVAPSLSWRGEDTTVTLSYFHEDYSRPYDRGGVYDIAAGRAAGDSRRTRLDEPYNVSKGTSDLASAFVDHQLTEDWKISAGYAYSRNEYGFDQARVTAYNARTGLVTRTADANTDVTSFTHSARADLTGTAEIGGFRNDLLFGLSYDYSDALVADRYNCTRRGLLDPDAPVYGQLPTCRTISLVNSDQVEQLSTGSAFLQDSLHLTDRWILVGGLRYQAYDVLAGKGRPFNVNTDGDGTALVPNGGLVYKLTDTVSLYANAAETFRPQSSTATYYGALPPEEGTSYEIGGKAELGGGLTANLALYTSRKRNVVYSELIDGISYVKTAGLVRAQGVELDIAGRLTDEIELIASYGYTDAKVLEDPQYAGLELPNVARHTGSLSLAYTLEGLGDGDDALRFGGGVRVAGKRPGQNDNAYFLPSYGVVDAFAAYTFALDNPLTVQLNVKNLFDEDYFVSSFGSSNLGNEYGEPLSASLTMKVDF